MALDYTLVFVDILEYVVWILLHWYCRLCHFSQTHLCICYHM